MKINKIQECKTDHIFQVGPGVFPAMSESDYHRGPGREALSKSLLVELARSPLHCKQAMESPREPTAAMQIGSAVHCAILEPSRFQDTYAMLDQDRRTKAGKDAYQAIVDAGQTPLSVSDWEAIRGMTKAVHSHPGCRDLLAEGLPEVSIFWTAPVWETLCKGRCDWLNQERRLIVDLKTCVDASPGAFGRDAAKFRYHWQAAWYLTGAEAILGPGEWRFLFVAIEKAPPYGVNVFELPLEAVEVAGEQIKPLVATFWNCIEEGVWPGYEPAIRTLNLPRWAMNLQEDSYYE
jgi:hypothetical protein